MFSRVLLASISLIAAVPLAGCASIRLRPSEMRQIVGRTYVVTGASSGFGHGVAVKLGGMGANVVLAARRTELLEEVANQVRAAGGSALVVTTDVANPEDIQRLADATVARFGRIDVWINNAGVGAIGRFEDVPVADQARIVDVNLKGVIYGSHAAMRRFRAQGHGTLVNIGSVESKIPLAYHTTYAATKAGVLSIGRSLNEEIRLSGNKRIKVSTVMPWATDTPWFNQAGNYSGGRPRMVLMDGPEKAVDAIVWASIHPREEVAVGWKGQAASSFHQLFPDLTERVAADIYHRAQITTAPPAPPTSGAVHRPVPEAKGIDGGVRARMKREDAERRARARAR